MLPRTLSCFALSLCAGIGFAQEVPRSGTWGLDLFALKDARGGHSLWMASRIGTTQKLADLSAPPSRWWNGRRHMAPEEVRILRDGSVFILPLGDSKTNGALAVLDFRSGALRKTEIKLVSPPNYEPLLDTDRRLAVCASDSGTGDTVLECVSWSGAGGAKSLGRVRVKGSPAGGVTRMHREGDLCFVPTTAGVHVLRILGGSKVLEPKVFVSSGARSPVTNLAAFPSGSNRRFAILCSDFDTGDLRPKDAAVLSFDASGNAKTHPVGNVPNTSPPKPYVPAVGFHSPGVASRNGISYVAFLLREKEPGTGYTKPAGVAVLGAGAPTGETFCVVRTTAAAGEPFAEIAVHGARMAFMTSQSPRWWPHPKGGSERLNVLYTPLDPLGAGTLGGVIGTAGPLGGRIGVEVTDRPLWSRDGKNLFVTTVNYPGAPNPGTSGSEVLAVPDARALNPLQDPMRTLISLRDQRTERAYGLPTVFEPWDMPLMMFGQASLFGQFAQTAAHAVLLPHKVSGSLATDTRTYRKLPRDINIPGFPAIPPRSFRDAGNRVSPPPKTFGARRASFNLWTRTNSLLATYLVQADGDELFYQTSGINLLSFGIQVPVLTVKLPSSSITTTEILSL